jgi:hypothetical protein
VAEHLSFTAIASEFESFDNELTTDTNVGKLTFMGTSASVAMNVAVNGANAPVKHLATDKRSLYQKKISTKSKRKSVPHLNI